MHQSGWRRHIDLKSRLLHHSCSSLQKALDLDRPQLPSASFPCLQCLDHQCTHASNLSERTCAKNLNLEVTKLTAKLWILGLGKPHEGSPFTFPHNSGVEGALPGGAAGCDQDRGAGGGSCDDQPSNQAASDAPHDRIRACLAQMDYEEAHEFAVHLQQLQEEVLQQTGLLGPSALQALIQGVWEVAQSRAIMVMIGSGTEALIEMQPFKSFQRSALSNTDKCLSSTNKPMCSC